MPTTSIAHFLKKSDDTLERVAANAKELAHLEPFRVKLEASVRVIREISVQQAPLKAQQQQFTRDQEAALKEGRENLTRVHNGIRSQYGLTGEKLTEFGLKPRRAPLKKKEKPPEQAQSATQAATPNTV
jgi:hypothetical protein